MENKKNDNQQPTVASAHHPFYLGEMKKGDVRLLDRYHAML